jgi:hypothetical protein
MAGFVMLEAKKQMEAEIISRQEFEEKCNLCSNPQVNGHVAAADLTSSS